MKLAFGMDAPFRANLGGATTVYGRRALLRICGASSGPTQPGYGRGSKHVDRHSSTRWRRIHHENDVSSDGISTSTTSTGVMHGWDTSRMTFQRTVNGLEITTPIPSIPEAPPRPSLPPKLQPRPVLSRAELAERVQVLLLAGGDSDMAIANTRAVAALPFGGNLRLIDVPIHNMAQSGINKMYVLSQYNSYTLFTHLSSSYPAIAGGPRNESFVEPLACTQTTTSSNWYRGAAEAVARNIGSIMERGGHEVEDFIIASGTALYQLDMLDVVHTHRQSNADITIVTRSVSKEEAKRLGVVVVEPLSGLVQAFVEKPEDNILTDLSHGSRHTSSAQPYEANQGVYVFRKETLLNLLADTDEQTAHVQFGRDVLPAALSWGLTIAVHHNDKAWHEISNLRDYYQANMQLLASGGPVDLQDMYNNPLREQELLPPSRILGANVTSCLVGEGSIIRDSMLRSCVLGVNSYISQGCDLEGVVLLGNSQYQSCSLQEAAHAEGRIVQGVGKDCVIRHAIIDSDSSIGSGCHITNSEGVQEADRSDDGFIIQDGLIVVLRNAVIPADTII